MTSTLRLISQQDPSPAARRGVRCRLTFAASPARLLVARDPLTILPEHHEGSQSGKRKPFTRLFLLALKLVLQTLEMSHNGPTGQYKTPARRSPFLLPLLFSSVLSHASFLTRDRAQAPYCDRKSTPDSTNRFIPNLNKAASVALPTVKRHGALKHNVKQLGRRV